ncbi:MAG: mechanosensitive ion channel family protein [Kiritimatiellia bacterium]
MQRFIDALVEFWHFPVYSSAGNLIRLHQIVLAIAIFLVGIAIARRVNRVAIQAVRRKVRLSSSTGQILERGIFYFLMMLTALIALPMAGIPVTIFTVLGGAIAIGFGFGAQNLFNNLISGVILLFEQPIRVGDIVEIDQEIGKVEEIGNRCVRMRRPDGADLLLPNSRFLEQRVINWSLFDDNIRGRVTVGVAYGSDTALVKQLLLETGAAHTKVHPQPVPLVLFDDFGDNALHFTLYFWCRVSRPIDLRMIESELRFSIDAAFRSAGVVIAFPQRDVHVDFNGPIPVQVEGSLARR